MNKKLLNIREAAQFLKVSIDTLRRWDKNGKLVATRKAKGTHRFYAIKDLEMFSSDLIKSASEWVLSKKEISQDVYCSNSAVFQARLIKMQNEMLAFKKDPGFVSLAGAISGEIGNNSYDHNLGNWPDVHGVFFGYNIQKGIIVLADRGLGILKTLSRVKPSLVTHKEALRVAFTEMISGRSPEKRGNGLKFVHKVITENPISLFFQTGDSDLQIEKESGKLYIEKTKDEIHGCIAIIKF